MIITNDQVQKNIRTDLLNWINQSNRIGGWKDHGDTLERKKSFKWDCGAGMLHMWNISIVLQVNISNTIKFKLIFKLLNIKT